MQSQLDPLIMALRAATMSGARSRWERVTAAVRELGKLQATFEESEVLQLLIRLGVVSCQPDDPEGLSEGARVTQGWMGRLEEAGMIYSPTPGRYRLI